MRTFPLLIAACLVFAAGASSDSSDELSCSALQGSPLHIQPPFAWETNALVFDYPAGPKPFDLDTAGGLSLVSPISPGSVTYRGATYKAESLRLVAPAEHSIGHAEGPFPAELQVLHRAADGSSLAVSVLFREHQEGSRLLDQLLGALKQRPAHPLRIDLHAYVAAAPPRYFAYSAPRDGQPGCDHSRGGADHWVVLRRAKRLSAAQLLALQQALPSLKGGSRAPSPPLPSTRIFATHPDHDMPPAAQPAAHPAAAAPAPAAPAASAVPPVSQADVARLEEEVKQESEKLRAAEAMLGALKAKVSPAALRGHQADAAPQPVPVRAAQVQQHSHTAAADTDVKPKKGRKRKEAVPSVAPAPPTTAAPTEPPPSTVRLADGESDLRIVLAARVPPLGAEAEGSGDTSYQTPRSLGGKGDGAAGVSLADLDDLPPNRDMSRGPKSLEGGVDRAQQALAEGPYADNDDLEIF